MGGLAVVSGRALAGMDDVLRRLARQPMIVLGSVQILTGFLVLGPTLEGVARWLVGGGGAPVLRMEELPAYVAYCVLMPAGSMGLNGLVNSRWRPPVALRRGLEGTGDLLLAAALGGSVAVSRACKRSWTTTLPGVWARAFAVARVLPPVQTRGDLVALAAESLRNIVLYQVLALMIAGELSAAMFGASLIVSLIGGGTLVRVTELCAGDLDRIKLYRFWLYLFNNSLVSLLIGATGNVLVFATLAKVAYWGLIVPWFLREEVQ